VPQNTVSYQKDGYTYDDIVRSMRIDGWKDTPGKELDIVRMQDGRLTSVDNTRVTAAREVGINVEGNLRNYNDPLTPAEVERFTRRRFPPPKTWGEAVEVRIKGQGGRFARENPLGSYETPRVTGRPESPGTPETP
jgi:filamentous hemagglutinin